jgi:hypothetical protein
MEPTTHRADVGHGQGEKRLVEVRDLVGGAGGVEHLEERHRVDGDARIVAGEGLLARNVEHLLHDVHLLADLLHVGKDQAEAGPEGPGIAPEPLDRIGVALRHRSHPHGDRHDDDQDDGTHEEIETKRHEASRQRDHVA